MTTWNEVLARKLDDGTAWTEGFTAEEIALPITDVEYNPDVPPESITKRDWYDLTEEERAAFKKKVGITDTPTGFILGGDL